MVHHTIVQDIRFSVGEITCQMIKESNYEKGYIKKKRLNETITYIYMYKLLLQYNNSVLNSISLKFKQKQLLRKNKELIKIATYIISKYLYEDCNYKYDLAEKKWIKK